jgi:hypothetical protein
MNVKLPYEMALAAASVAMLLCRSCMNNLESSQFDKRMIYGS